MSTAENTFSFRGRTYTYHQTARYERRVELPIIWAEVEAEPGRVLEVGNVLSGYYPIHHDVLDKHDPAPTVIRADAAHWKPAGRYDLIVSISTIEHIGREELPYSFDVYKPLAAVYSLLWNALADGGRMLVTMPMGYSQPVDVLVENGDFPFAWLGYLAQIAPDTWCEASYGEEVRWMQYGHPYAHASAVLIGQINARPHRL